MELAATASGRTRDLSFSFFISGFVLKAWLAVLMHNLEFGHKGRTTLGHGAKRIQQVFSFQFSRFLSFLCGEGALGQDGPSPRVSFWFHSLLLGLAPRLAIRLFLWYASGPLHFGKFWLDWSGYVHGSHFLLRQLEKVAHELLETAM